MSRIIGWTVDTLPVFRGTKIVDTVHEARQQVGTNAGHQALHHLSERAQSRPRTASDFHISTIETLEEKKTFHHEAI